MTSWTAASAAAGCRRPFAGAVTVVVIGVLVALVAVLFRGGFTESVPVTVLSPRAGLVLNPDAKVELRGVQVGTVSSLEDLPDGVVALHLSMNPAKISEIPANVTVDIASTTVFGAKYVQFIDPADPSLRPMYPGQVLDARHVTVEINTVFQRLTQVLSSVDPMKMNETLGAIASAVDGRGHEMGRMLTDLDSYLATLEPALPALRHDVAALPTVAGSYADAASDLLAAAANTNRISATLVDKQHDLDTLLLSTIGLAGTGNDVLATNSKQLADVIHLLVPTTDLTDRYHDALYCLLGGLVRGAYIPNPQVPGAMVDAGFTMGRERYRYPTDLPKVAATGGPQCVAGLPNVPFEARPPYVVADVGIDPGRYGNQGIVLNADSLKQWLFGPLAGPPRNSAQIGQPG